MTALDVCDWIAPVLCPALNRQSGLFDIAVHDAVRLECPGFDQCCYWWHGVFCLNGAGQLARYLTRLQASGLIPQAQTRLIYACPIITVPTHTVGG